MYLFVTYELHTTETRNNNLYFEISMLVWGFSQFGTAQHHLLTKFVIVFKVSMYKIYKILDKPNNCFTFIFIIVKELLNFKFRSL